ncbi:protease modulator HflK, partial [Pseudomonas aeruginosa]
SNNNNRDPWGGRRGGGGGGGDRKGPPDLDEAFRQASGQPERAVGGKKRSGNGSGSGSGGKGGGLALFGIGLAILAVLWLYNAIYVVDEQEQAVILRFGKSYETVGPGLNFYFPPIDKRFQENVTPRACVQQAGADAHRGRDIVEVPLTVQYKISNLQDFVLNVDQPEVSLQQATESAAACRRLHHHGPDPHRRPRADGDQSVRAPATLPGYLQDRYHRDPGEHSERQHRVRCRKRSTT